jgi:hypothetical protein
MKSEVKKIDYTGQEIYCGLDVHKKRWQITVCTKHTIQRSVSIERPFVQNLKRHLEKKYPGAFTMLPTKRDLVDSGHTKLWRKMA